MQTTKFAYNRLQCRLFVAHKLHQLSGYMFLENHRYYMHSNVYGVVYRGGVLVRQLILQWFHYACSTEETFLRDFLEHFLKKCFFVT